MSIKRLIIAGAVIPIIIAGCSTGVAPEKPGQSTDPTVKRSPAELTANEKETAAAVNRFTFKLFKEVASLEPPDKNLFISPLSVSFALGMTLNGAAGQTQSQMAEVLGLGGMTVEEINEAYRGLMGVLTHLDPAVIFTVANSIWYREHLPIRPEFVDVNREFFDAEVRGIDFNASWAADTINQWINLHTYGMIEKMIDPPIDPTVVIMLINAIYFKGAWTIPFDTAYTATLPFTKTDGSTVTCRMMGNDTLFYFYTNDDFNSISLSYGQEGFSMMIILPHDGSNMPDIIQNVTTEDWDTWRNGLVEQKSVIGLPRFRYSHDIKLNEILPAMGMTLAFDPGQADFSNMFDGVPLFISDVLHKAILQVDEKGTEAAAATIVMGTTSLPPTVFCNRPFLFLIYERVSGTILFIGRLSDPVWEN